MARTLKDSKLDKAEARRKLEARGKPYYRLIEEGLHLGYRRMSGRAGTWCVRRYVGNQQYSVSVIGIANNNSDADGDTILDFAQAQNKARAYLSGARKKAGPFTVKAALEEYFEKIEDEGKSAYDARRRIEPYVQRIVNTECDKLDARELRKWLLALSRAPARLRTAKGKKQQHRDLDHKDAETVRRRKATANRTWTVLRAALNFAYREGKIASAAAWERVEPFEDVDAARIRFLTLAEAQRLINARILNLGH